MQKMNPKPEQMTNAELYRSLLGKTPFVRPWMEPYLPANVYLRDALVGVVLGALDITCVIGFALTLKLFVGEDTAFLIALVPMGLALAFTLGRIHSRYLVATVKFKRIRSGK